MFAVTAQQMKALDKAAIDKFGIPGLVLMENAGRGIFEVLNGCSTGDDVARVLILCGPGNNGGDGYVVARHCANAGYEVRIFATVPREKLKGDARVNCDAAVRMGIDLTVLHDVASVRRAFKSLRGVDAVVDALLGTGASSELSGAYLEMVRQANDLSAFKLAVDVPTGLDSDSGAAATDVFRADVTVTCGLPKIGLYLDRGIHASGAIEVVDISMPRSLLREVDGVRLLDSALAVPSPPERPVDAHKNNMGHLLAIAGSPGKVGAALLCGHAALRTGVGLCTVACHSGCRAHVEGVVPDLMVEGLDMDCRPDTGMESLVAGKTAIAIGPGLGVCDEAKDLVRWVFQQSGMAVVGDADVFSAYADNLKGIRRDDLPTILTPHPGEMARLLGVKTADVAADRLGIAAMVAKETGAVVVLKGAHSVIAAPDGRRALNLSGTPAMAKAGSGDVLTGMLGALLAMGMDPFDAALLGTYAHGRCGESCAAKSGTHGVTASDLVQAAPEVFMHIENGDDEHEHSCEGCEIP